VTEEQAMSCIRDLEREVSGLRCQLIAAENTIKRQDAWRGQHERAMEEEQQDHMDVMDALVDELERSETARCSAVADRDAMIKRMAGTLMEQVIYLGTLTNAVNQ
jgi:post-segregation antitoxin (ccd killing protein)